MLLLSPIAPHICDELWERLGLRAPILAQPWPQADASLDAEETITIAVQVMGKLRDSIEVPAGTDMDRAVEQALASGSGACSSAIRQRSARWLTKRGAPRSVAQ